MSNVSAMISGFVLLSVVSLMLRWPGRTLGLAAALVAWTAVGPWAFWSVLGVVVLGAVTWRHFVPNRSLLMRYPLVGVFAGSAGTALATSGSTSMVALCTALGAIAGLTRPLP